ncbi:MAG: hypothetical protein IT434_18855, partial [Phycisphaerales bacterium]|nr:hypothetical protein [Phycisphaerales bacterium]
MHPKQTKNKHLTKMPRLVSNFAQIISLGVSKSSFVFTQFLFFLWIINNHLRKQQSHRKITNKKSDIIRFSVILIFLFLSTRFLFSESYKEHRLDDLNYANQGRKTIKNEGRIESSTTSNKDIDSNESQKTTKSDFAVSSYLTPKFYSQKGGDKEDIAGRYANQVNFSPELVGYRKGANSKYMLLVAPILSYREDFQLKRNVNRPIDTEIIGAW